jgi:polar amino acid transport system substrate-binding protein
MPSASSHPLLRAARFGLALAVAPLALAADGLTEIAARQTLRVGVADFAPWTFVNREGRTEGFEIDLAHQLAHDLGAKAEFKLASLPDLFAALDRGEIDLIAAGLAITPARARQADFTLPYFESGVTLVVARRLAAESTTAGALNRKGLAIGVVADTYSAGLAAELYDEAELRRFPDRPTAEAELVAGRVQALVTNIHDARILVRAHPAELALPLDAPLVRSVAGFAVKRGNQAVLNYLNAWIASRLADNLIPNLTDSWFGGYEWTRRMKPAAN